MAQIAEMLELQSTMTLSSLIDTVLQALAKLFGGKAQGEGQNAFPKVMHQIPFISSQVLGSYQSSFSI